MFLIRSVSSLLGKFNKPLRFSIEFLTLAFFHSPETIKGIKKDITVYHLSSFERWNGTYFPELSEIN